MLQAVLLHINLESLQRLIVPLILLEAMCADFLRFTCNVLFGTVISAKDIPTLFAMVFPAGKKIKLELAILTC